MEETFLKNYCEFSGKLKSIEHKDVVNKKKIHDSDPDTVTCVNVKIIVSGNQGSHAKRRALPMRAAFFGDAANEILDRFAVGDNVNLRGALDVSYWVWNNRTMSRTFIRGYSMQHIDNIADVNETDLLF